MPVEKKIEELEEKIRALKKEVRKLKRFSNLGRSAARIAHDMRNVLSPIAQYVVLMEAEGLESDIMPRIKACADRGIEYMDSLVHYATAGKQNEELLNLNEIVDAVVVPFKKNRRRKEYEIEAVYSSKSKVRGDKVQLERLTQNLITNAIDALEKEGEIKVTTGNYQSNGKEIPKGSYVVLGVKDTGIGMSDEVKEKIFDPFFSTKKNLGDGLGLATVKHVVDAHDAYFRVSSEEGKGSTFSVYFPVK